MSKPIQRFSSSLLPMGDQWLGSRIHPWQTAYVHDAEIRGDAWIQGTVEIGARRPPNEHVVLFVQGPTLLDGTLAVDETTTINGNFHATQDVHLSAPGLPTIVQGTLTVDETTTINGNFHATQDVHLSAPGLPTIVQGTLTVDETATIDADFVATGDVTLSSPGRPTIVQGTLTVDETATINGDFHATQDVHLSTPGRPTIVQGTLTVDETATIDADFHATQDVHLSAPGRPTVVQGTLTVDETATINGNFHATEDVHLSAPGRPTIVQGTLTVDETATIDADFVATGDVTLSSPTKTTQVQGDMHVDGSIHTTFLYTDWIFSDAPIHVPKGIIADTVLGGDMVCKKTVADLTIAEDGLFGTVLVDRNVGRLADARTITNTTPLLDALTMVESLQGIRFMQHGQSRIGMVADQVASHVPEAVMTSAHPGAYKYISYETLVPLLIESVKILHERVHVLESALESQSANS